MRIHAAVTLTLLVLACKTSSASNVKDVDDSQSGQSQGASSDGASDACAKEVAPLLDALFANLGHDCPTYVSLFTPDAKYYHQHDGFKLQPDLLKNCQSYATFCPGNQCRFLQDGAAAVVARGSSCHILVPYIWSEIPANNVAKGNLEPHTGWEYIVASPDGSSPFDYRMSYFAELETTYSEAFNWAKPDDTPAVVAQSTLQLLSLQNSASKGECNSPVAPTVTAYFNNKNSGADTWRQQGDAVVLAAGGLCHVAVPYAAQVGDKLESGRVVFTLAPAAGNTYNVVDTVEFPRAVL